MGDLARIPRNHAWDDPTSAGNTPLRFPLGDLTNSRHVSDPHRPLHKCHRASKVSIASRGLGMSSPTTSTVNTLATTQGNPSAISGIPSYRHNSKTYSVSEVHQTHMVPTGRNSLLRCRSFVCPKLMSHLLD